MQRGSQLFGRRGLAMMIAIALAFGLVAAGGWVFRQVQRRYEGPYRGSADYVAEARIGATLETLDAETARSLGTGGQGKGVVVTSLAGDGAAARGGLRTGDVIESIGKHAIASREDAAAALKSVDAPIALGLNRRGHHAIVRLPVQYPRDGAGTDQGEER